METKFFNIESWRSGDSIRIAITKWRRFHPEIVFADPAVGKGILENFLQQAQYPRPDGPDYPDYQWKEKTFSRGDAADHRCIEKFPWARYQSPQTSGLAWIPREPQKRLLYINLFISGGFLDPKGKWINLEAQLETWFNGKIMSKKPINELKYYWNRSPDRKKLQALWDARDYTDSAEAV